MPAGSTTRSPMMAASSPSSISWRRPLLVLLRAQFGWIVIFGDMRILHGHPGDSAEIDAVLVLENAANPDARGLRIGAHADLPAFQVLRPGLCRSLSAQTRLVCGSRLHSGNASPVIGLPKWCASRCVTDRPSRRGRDRRRAPCGGRPPAVGSKSWNCSSTRSDLTRPSFSGLHMRMLAKRRFENERSSQKCVPLGAWLNQ